MDLLSLIGIVLAFVALLAGAILKGAGLHSLVSSAAMMIVVVGTFAAILVQTPGRVMKRAFGIFPWVFRSPVLDAASHRAAPGGMEPDRPQARVAGP